MKVEQKEHITIVKDTQDAVKLFLEKITQNHNSFKSKNLIIDLSLNKDITLQEIKLFSEVSKTHKKEKKSFIIVANGIDFNALPTKLIVVPTLQEAFDIVEMEEIERDLGF